jgi:hypothetical protein
MKRYVRNKFLVLSLAGGLTAVGVGSILGEVPGQIAGIKSPSDLMALLSGRSPGDRAAGALANKTKRPIVEHKMAERDTPATAMAVPPAAMAVAPLLAPPAAAAAVPAAAALVPAAASSSGFFLPPFLAPLGGGGGGITVAAVPPVTVGEEPPPPPPGPAVPEPDTWLMLTIGFGALGGILRRRRKLSANEGRAQGSLTQSPATA